jgi:hypothetical protein
MGIRKTLLISLIAAGAASCGTPRGTPAHPPSAITATYPAARWIPGRPTYVLAARSVREAQRSVKDVVDSFGIVGDLYFAALSADLQRLLAVDPLVSETVASIGVDVDGGFAAFSEGIHPTIVVHLKSPEQTQAFFDQLRERGIRIASAIVDGTEIYSTQITPKVKVSWVIAGDWLWVHFTLPIARDEGAHWFSASHDPGDATWLPAWSAAIAKTGGAQPSVAGFADLRAILAALPNPLRLSACAHLFDPVQTVAFAVDGDGKRATGRLAIEVGAAAVAAIRRATLPTLDGWASVTDHAAIAAQWNLDLPALDRWIEPCARLAGFDAREWSEPYGLRTARVVVRTVDPDAGTGTGAAAFDLEHKRFFAGELDRIPMRGRLESARRFGPYDGQTLSIPFTGLEFEYVLTDTIALAGVGEGLLARAVGRGPSPSPPPIAQVDIVPAALPKAAWEMLLRPVTTRAAAIAEQLVRWRDGHLMIAVDATRIVLEATGNRR